MAERSQQTKGVLRVFGYDPEGAAAPPKPAPTSSQPVWSQQDIEDFIKANSVAVPAPINHDFNRAVAAQLEAARLDAAEFRRRLLTDKMEAVLDKVADGRVVWRDNAVYAHVSGEPK